MGAAGDHDERLTPEQVTKLHKDLEVVQANMAVFNEMLNTLIPGQEHSSDIELITVSINL
jgi:GAT domain.